MLSASIISLPEIWQGILPSLPSQPARQASPSSIDEPNSHETETDKTSIHKKHDVGFIIILKHTPTITTTTTNYSQTFKIVETTIIK